MVSNRKGLVLESIGYIIIGLVSLTILLMLFSGTMKSATKDMYCSIYITMLTKLPFSDVSPPSYCDINKNEIKTVEIFKNDEFMDVLVGKAIDCYLTNKKYPINKEKICYELLIKGNDPIDIDETSLTDYLLNHGLCDLIQNSDVSVSSQRCGHRDEIDFRVGGGRITKGTGSVYIIYNYTSNKIVIK